MFWVLGGFWVLVLGSGFCSEFLSRLWVRVGSVWGSEFQWVLGSGVWVAWCSGFGEISGFLDVLISGLQ